MSLFNLIVGAGLLAAGVWLLWLALVTTRASRQAAAWPVHLATVLTSGISTIGLYRTFPSGGVAKRLDVRYAWSIDGQRFEGTRERFTIWRLGGQSPAATQTALANAMPGATIEIRVDPDDPHEAVVDPSVDQAAVLTAALLGLLFGSSGVWRLITGF